nr:FAD-dependent urate hydroxylase-like [Ipomoea batatas]
MGIACGLSADWESGISHRRMCQLLDLDSVNRSGSSSGVMGKEGCDGTLLCNSDGRIEILIGCDGGRSIVAELLGLKAAKEFGVVATRGLTTYPNAHSLPIEFHRMFKGDVRVGILPINHHLVHWFVTFPTRQLSGEKFTRDENAIKQKAPRFTDKEDAVVLTRCLGSAVVKNDINGIKNEERMARIEEALENYVKERRMCVALLSMHTYLIGASMVATSKLAKMVFGAAMALFFRNVAAQNEYDCADTFSKFSSHHRQTPAPSVTIAAATTGCAIGHYRPVRTAVQRCHRRRPVRPPVPPSPSSSSATSSATPSPASSFAAVDHFSDPPANRSEATVDAAALPPPKMLSDALPPPALPHSRLPR